MIETISFKNIITAIKAFKKLCHGITSYVIIFTCKPSLGTINHKPAYWLDPVSQGQNRCGGVGGCVWACGGGCGGGGGACACVRVWVCGGGGGAKSRGAR